MPLLSRAGVVAVKTGEATFRLPTVCPSCKSRATVEDGAAGRWYCTSCCTPFAINPPPVGSSPPVVEDSNPAPSPSAAGSRPKVEGSYAPSGKTQTFRPLDLLNLPSRPGFFRVEARASVPVQTAAEHQLFGKLARWMESKRPEEVSPIILTALLRACCEECPELMPLLAEWAGFPDRKEARHG